MRTLLRFSNNAKHSDFCCFRELFIESEQQVATCFGREKVAVGLLIVLRSQIEQRLPDLGRSGEILSRGRCTGGVLSRLALRNQRSHLIVTCRAYRGLVTVSACNLSFPRFLDLRTRQLYRAAEQFLARFSSQWIERMRPHVPFLCKPAVSFPHNLYGSEWSHLGVITSVRQKKKHSRSLYYPDLAPLSSKLLLRTSRL